MKYLYDIFKPNNKYKDVYQILINSFTEEVKKEACPKQLTQNLFISCFPNIYSFVDLPETALDFV